MILAVERPVTCRPICMASRTTCRPADAVCRAGAPERRTRSGVECADPELFESGLGATSAPAFPTRAGALAWKSTMRTVSEYLAEARDYDQRAKRTANPETKKLYADLAAAFRNLAEARKRAVEKGAIPPVAP